MSENDDQYDANSEGELNEEEARIISVLGGMEPGDIVTFANGSVVFRTEDDWEVTTQEQDTSSDKPTTEQAFRAFLRGE